MDVQNRLLHPVTHWSVACQRGTVNLSMPWLFNQKTGGSIAWASNLPWNLDVYICLKQMGMDWNLAAFTMTWCDSTHKASLVICISVFGMYTQLCKPICMFVHASRVVQLCRTKISALSRANMHTTCIWHTFIDDHRFWDGTTWQYHRCLFLSHWPWQTVSVPAWSSTGWFYQASLLTNKHILAWRLYGCL